MAAATVQKNIVFFTGFDGHVTTVIKPIIQFLNGFRRNRHKAFLTPFAKDTDKTFIEIKVAQREVYQFWHAQTTGKKDFNNGLVPMTFPFGKVDDVFQLIHFSCRKKFWQMFTRLRRFQEFGRILFEPTVKIKKAIEGAYAAQNTGLWRRGNTKIMKRSGKMLQVFQLHIQWVYAFPFQIEQQLLHIAQIGIQRVGREPLL